MDPIAALRLQDDWGMTFGRAGTSRGVAGRRLSARRGGRQRLQALQRGRLPPTNNLFFRPPFCILPPAPEKVVLKDRYPRRRGGLFCFKSRKLRQHVAVLNNKPESATDRCSFALAMSLFEKISKSLLTFAPRKDIFTVLKRARNEPGVRLPRYARNDNL